MTPTSLDRTTVGPMALETSPATDTAAPSDIPRPVGRLGPFFASIWLFFLINPLVEGWQHRDEVSGLVGIVATLLFAVLYMSIWWRVRRDTMQLRSEWHVLSHPAPYLLLLGALGAVMVGSLGEPGLAFVVYLGVAVVVTLPLRYAAALVVVLALGTTALGAVEGWGSQLGTTFGLLAASIAVFGMRTVMHRNLELVRAHRRNAELAVESERGRFARDLHDILGHSLTVITVKAELAGRLFDADPERARSEIADLERLSRDALADVRRAVEGYREITLPGELARARAALAAADIEADLPGSTDDIPSDLRELYAWTVREGVTNVIRHSAARRCTIALSASSAEIRDDGRGAADSTTGSGLRGLRERAAASAAAVICESPAAGGHLLRVLVRR